MELSRRMGVGGLLLRFVGGLRVGVVVRGFVLVCVGVCGGGFVAGPVWAQGGLCGNERVRGEQSFGLGLADCRAYEMVSPLAKGDNGVTYVDSRAAVSGEAVSYFSFGSFAGPESALLEGRYLSRREAGGWVTENISPPFTNYKGHVFGLPAFGELLFTPDLSRGVVESRYTPLVGGEPVGYTNLYVANTETGSYEAVTTVTPEAEYKPFEESTPSLALLPEAEGASSDLSHVVFQHRASLCCGASPHRVHVYEWAGGSLRQVDVPPPGGKLEGDDNVGSAAAVAEPVFHGDPWRAVSGDGLRVVFTGGETFKISNGEFEGQVYVRENPMSGVGGCSVVGGACTVEVSASQRVVPDPSAGKNSGHPPVAWYRDASVDGSRVFFTSRVELTNDAYTGPEDNAANLYEYDFNRPEGERLSDLTVDEGDADGAGVLGLVTASDDGSYVYFVAAGVLTSEKNGEGEEPVAGKPNLYLSHAGKVTFIATLAPDKLGHYDIAHTENGDEEDWVGEEGPPNTGDYGPGSHTARVTPDGSVLAFESELSLTKYDNEAVALGECEGERCREVYLFDAVTGKLVCVSCDLPSSLAPLGARPVGAAELGGHEEEGGHFSTGAVPFYLPRNLSEDGGRLFFQSPDGLVPSDSNGRLDVYEWERAGEGTCTTVSVSYAASHEGCTFSVSDVAGGSASHFMDASGSGNDVFIASGDQLTKSDTDAREDVYDVRVDGGFPVERPPPTCGSSGCGGAGGLQELGVFGAPASATFSGPGNPVSNGPPKPTVAQVRAEKLAKALSACRKRLHRSRERAVCEKRARRAYGKGR
jgi:hypothetical protein